MTTTDEQREDTAVARAVAQLVADWPPISDEKLDRIAVMLRRSTPKA